jgi:hypothetical protein
MCHHLLALVFEADELYEALRGDAQLSEIADEQVLMFILWKDQSIGKGANAASHIAKHNACSLLSGDPQSDGFHGRAVADNLVGYWLAQAIPCRECIGDAVLKPRYRFFRPEPNLSSIDTQAAADQSGFKIQRNQIPFMRKHWGLDFLRQSHVS